MTDTTKKVIVMTEVSEVEAELIQRAGADGPAMADELDRVLEELHEILSAEHPADDAGERAGRLMARARFLAKEMKCLWAIHGPQLAGASIHDPSMTKGTLS